jgi:hypothetical protein
MRRTASCVLMSLCLSGLAGCGGGSESTTAAGGDAVSTDPGRPVSGTRQLIGSWFNPDAEEIAGIEFASDGKVMITPAGFDRAVLAPTFTAEYASLDGGRLRVTMPDGETIIFTAGIRDNTLTLTPETLPEQTQRFHRLRNQSIAQAHREDVERLQKRHAELAESVDRFIAQPKLIIASTNPAATAGRVALRVDASHNTTMGVAYSDGDPVLQRQAQVAYEFAGLGKPIRVIVDIGGVVGPVGADQMQPRRETFVVDGEPGSIRLVGEGRHIVADAAAYDALVQRYEAVQAERLAMVQQVSDALAAQAVLVGAKTPNGGATRDVTAKPARVGNSNDFTGPITEADRAQPALGGVTWDAGQGVLLLRAGNELWRLTLAPDGSLVGNYRPLNAPQPAGTLALRIHKKWTADELAALKAAIQRYLTDDLRTPTELTGFVAGRVANADGFWPVHLQVQTHPDGSATGQAWLLAQRGGVELRGNVQQGVIVLQASRVLTPDADFRSFAQQQYRIEIEDMDPLPTLVGSLNMPTGGGGSLLLTSASDRSTAALRQHVLDSLKDAVFELRSSRHTNRPDAETFLKLTADAAGSVTGELIGRDLDGAYAPAVVAGSVKQDRGHVLLDLAFTTCISATRGGRAETVVPFILVARLDKEELTFRGSTNQGIFGLFTAVPTAHPYQPSDEHRIRLAAQRAGAVHTLPSSVAPGQAYVMLVQGTTRGHAYFGGGRYRATNPGVAAVHAGLVAEGETALLRVTITPPHDQAYSAGSQNGVTTQPVAMNATTQRAMTMTLEKLDPASIR